MSLTPERLEYHRAWRERNRERLRVKDADRRAQRGQSLKDYNAAYYERNRDHLSATGKAWHEAHREQVMEAGRQKALDDPIGVRARRAADKSNRKFGEYVPWEVYERIFRQPCVTCGKAPCMGADHIIEYADGGRNVETNLQPMCLRDNQRKGARARWARSRA